MRISDQDINTVRAKADIAQVIGHYIPLTKAGRNYKAVCPFHDDHDPSLSISTDKQIYKCFVCSAGGNVFTFVQNFEKISFPEAVAEVADLVGVKLDVQLDKPVEVIDPELQIIYKLHEEAIRYSAYQLHSSSCEKQMQYCLSRGLDEDCINTFNIGYIGGNNALYRFLSAKGYEDKDIVSAYLGYLSENGIYDVFANRLTFPIHDDKGRPIGFTARTLDPNVPSKYINTAETKAYVKGRILYNMHRAFNACKQEKKVYIVEGVMDVIAFYRAGIENVVATLGTACTMEQIGLMRRLASTIVFCYDGDKAGQNANYKAAKLAIQAGLNVKIVLNRTGLDPDEIVNQMGKEELSSMVKNELSWIEFCFEYLKNKTDMNNYSEKKAYALSMAEEILALKDEFDRDNFMHRLSVETGFSTNLLNPQSNQEPVKEKKKTDRPRPQRLSVAIDGQTNAEYTLLSQMLKSGRAVDLFNRNLGFLLGESNQKLAMILIDYYRTHERFEIADFLNYVEDPSLQKLAMDLDEWEIGFEEFNEKACLVAIDKVKSCIIDNKIGEIKKQFDIISDPISKANLINEKIELERQKAQLLHSDD